jgi:hypothetical protein
MLRLRVNTAKAIVPGVDQRAAEWPPTAAT